MGSVMGGVTVGHSRTAGMVEASFPRPTTEGIHASFCSCQECGLQYNKGITTHVGERYHGGPGHGEARG